MKKFLELLGFAGSLHLHFEPSNALACTSGVNAVNIGSSVADRQTKTGKSRIRGQANTEPGAEQAAWPAVE